VENYPLRVGALPAETFASVMQALGFGLGAAHGSATATATARSCLVAIGAMAAETLKHSTSADQSAVVATGSQHAQALRHFFEQLLTKLLFDDAPVELVSDACFFALQRAAL